MKRTRIFLATACLAIAIAGVAATKANTTTVTEYYYDNSSTPKCLSEVINDPICSPGTSGCQDGSARQLYSGITDETHCDQALQLGH